MKIFNGKVPFPTKDGTKMRDNAPFMAELSVLSRPGPENGHHKRKPGLLVDRNGNQFPIMVPEFEALQTFITGDTPGQTINGVWFFTKRNNTFGLKFFGVVLSTAEMATAPAKKPAKPKKPVKPVKKPTKKAPKKPAMVANAVKHNRFAICVDRSGSMGSIRASSVTRAVNAILNSVRTNAARTGQPTTVSILEFGAGGLQPAVKWVVAAEPAATVEPYQYCHGDGDTPLFECVGVAIDAMRHNVVDMEDPNTSFFVYAITDGQENASNPRFSPFKVNNTIRTVQATDRWTFAFQLPRTYLSEFTRLYSVPPGNVQGWVLTDDGVMAAGQSTAAGVGAFYGARMAGLTSTNTLYEQA